MVAHLVRLKLALLANGLRRSAWQVVGLVVAALYGMGAIVVVMVAAAAVSVREPDVRGPATVLVGSVLVLGWWVVPLVSFGVDATVDPARFATFTIPRRSMLVGLALGAVIGIPGVVTAVSALAAAGVWWRTPAALLVAPACALLGLATCIVGSRATTSASARLMGRRRVRELMAAVALVPLILVGPLLGRASQSSGLGSNGLERIADVLGWTPVGAVWAVPWAVADGDRVGALARFAIAVGTLGLVAVVWDRALAHALVNPDHEVASGRVRGLGWFGRLPATPTGAVTARSLTYWARDPRYALAMAIVPLLPLILWIVDPGGSLLLLVAPTVAFFLGWGISADVAYDGSAFWTHVAAPVTGLTDRLGRVLGASVLALPVVLAFAVGSALVTGRPDAIPALLGLAVGVLCTAYGGASVVSAFVVYPVQQPGENPFQTRQGASMTAVVSQLAGWAAVLVLSAPETILAVLAITQRSAVAGWAALVVGPALGGLLLVLGLRVGGRVLERNGSDLLRRILSFA